MPFSFHPLSRALYVALTSSLQLPPALAPPQNSILIYPIGVFAHTPVSQTFHAPNKICDFSLHHMPLGLRLSQFLSSSVNYITQLYKPKIEATSCFLSFSQLPISDPLGNYILSLCSIYWNDLLLSSSSYHYPRLG